jgi:hypothetical protein
MIDSARAVLVVAVMTEPGDDGGRSSCCWHGRVPTAAIRRSVTAGIHGRGVVESLS